ncbi:hypothetical protein COW49_01670 [Candidatus Kaiserbacteria bacterium CG17_big_fil_post_rev_8_21_14_2_50_51_7]|uniref:Uncharacterized protein n=1 Tax=Candidatus Kaiserbacteria bacterium CG17_big_fil_post_rev_8_21_14_2_50_51_7 TaxID=1974613 RepID=A0A2M7FC71_9BACT|nr:MAG: hypothetical protein COW49_01670 [Candidatus Kaiserbacteria bacterium CG17_big_fil_post_rev_8_21_14_2_50_51_7]
MNETFDVISMSGRTRFVEEVRLAILNGWHVRDVWSHEVEVDRNHNKDVCYYAWLERGYSLPMPAALEYSQEYSLEA